MPAFRPAATRCGHRGATALPRGVEATGDNAPASRILSIRCHEHAERPRGWRGRSGESAVCGALDPAAMWWARGDLNPHVLTDTRT
jgi:hypothetical protein